jgi:hypothetical protein
VEHDPHAILFVQTNLDEVVAGAERSRCGTARALGLFQLGMLLDDLVPVRRTSGGPAAGVSSAPFVVRAAVVRAPVRDALLNAVRRP